WRGPRSPRSAHRRRLGAWACSAASRGFGRAAGRPIVHSVGTLRAQAAPRPGAARGLVVSLGNVFKNLLLERQFCHQALELEFFLLQLLQPLGLIEPESAVLLAPAVVALLADPGIAARLWRALAVSHLNLDLPQQTDDLFGLVFLGWHTSALPRVILYHARWYKNPRSRHSLLIPLRLL